MAGPPHDDVVIPGLADDAERADWARARRRGVTHARALEPRAPGPGEPVVVHLTAGPDAPPGEAWLEVEGDTRALEEAGSAWDTLAWGYVRSFRSTIPGRDAGVVRYRLGVGDVEADEGAPQGYVVGDTGPPSWVESAVIYQVWVDRFWSPDREWPGRDTGPDDRYGGTLAGLCERLDHIERLSANTLWLNPIHPSSAYHGYEVTDFRDVDPGLGSLDDFDRLVAELHRRRIRLVLDFIPSHVSHRHPAFIAARTDANSPFTTWFRFHRWPDSYVTFFDVPTMPQLEHRTDAVREHLIDAARFWLDRGVDGFRLDYAGGASYEFWAEFRAAVRRANPECWLFGEVVDTPAAQLTYEGLFDGCLDFQLAQALRGAFGYRDLDGAALATFLDAHEAAFPRRFSRPSFFDNHDLNRLLWIARGDTRRLRLAATCQFTLAGPPIVYYGTEVGRSQQRGVKAPGVETDDRHARLPMLWGRDQDADLLAFYRELGALRRERAELQLAPRETLNANPSRIAYARGPVVVELDLDAGAGIVRDGREVLLRC